MESLGAGDGAYDILEVSGAARPLKNAIRQKYEVKELIGKGSFGCVLKAQCRLTGRLVALKIVIN